MLLPIAAFALSGGAASRAEIAAPPTPLRAQRSLAIFRPASDSRNHWKKA